MDVIDTSADLWYCKAGFCEIAAATCCSTHPLLLLGQRQVQTLAKSQSRLFCVETMPNHLVEAQTHASVPP